MERRSPSLTEIPTFQEAGFKGLANDQWLGVFVPSGTPTAIVTRLNLEIGKALADPAVQRNFLEADQEPVGASSAQLARFVHVEGQTTGGLVKALNIKRA